MWVYTGTANYLVKVASEENVIKLSATDMVYIWNFVTDRRDIVNLFKDTNPIFEMEDTAIIEKVLNLYRNEAVNHAFTVTSDGTEELQIESSSSINSFPYSLRITLKMAGPLTLYDEWTLPMMQLVKSLHERELRLVEIIRAKDQEIEQYKEEGAEIQRHGVITAPFSYEAFDVTEMELKSTQQPASIINGKLQERLAKFCCEPCEASSSETVDTVQKREEIRPAQPKPSAVVPALSCLTGPMAKRKKAVPRIKL